MSVEKILTDELKAVGSALVTPPPPDAGALVVLAGRNRTRRTFRTAATVVLTAAAVAASVALGSQLGKHDASPSPSHQPTGLPTGAPPQVPYLVKNVIFAGNQQYPGSWSLVIAQGSSAIGVQPGVNGAGSIIVFHNLAEVARISHIDNAQRPLLSRDGSKLAYVEIGTTDAQLVVRDLNANRELGRLAVNRQDFTNENAPNGGWKLIERVDDNGTVHYGSARGGYAWTPGSAPVAGARVDPSGVQVGFPSNATEVAISANGGWGAWLQAAAGSPPVMSGGTPVTLRAQRPGKPSSQVVIPVHLSYGANDLVWESSTTVLFNANDDENGDSFHVVRCSIVTDRCELAATPSTR